MRMSRRLAQGGGGGKKETFTLAPGQSKSLSLKGKVAFITCVCAGNTSENYWGLMMYQFAYSGYGFWFGGDGLDGTVTAAKSANSYNATFSANAGNTNTYNIMVIS